VKVPTSPGWGPVFGGRPAAAAVLAAPPGVDLDFAAYLLRREVRLSLGDGRLVIQARARCGKLPLTLSENYCFCPGGARKNWFWVFRNRSAAV